MPAERVRSTLKRLGLPPQYLLFVGGHLSRGKTSRRCCGPTSPRLQTSASRYPLLIVGGWGWRSGDVRRLMDDAKHRGVRHVGYVADKHLPALYNGYGPGFPSFYAGFGLPPVEMMACGGAVLGSTAGAVEEVVGRQAHLIPSHDLDSNT